MNLAAVIVETRPLVNLKQVIEDHLKFLPKYTKLYVFGSTHVDLLLSQAEFKYEFHNVGVKLSEWGYNLLLTSKQFWESIQEENVLIFQHDSEILRDGIEYFYRYDYAGAPWKFYPHGGNGGLSFRKKKAMIDCIEVRLWTQEQGNEDVYFSKILKSIECKMSRAACDLFSCETIFKLGTFGCHAIDKHLSKEECKQIRNQYK